MEKSNCALIKLVVGVLKKAVFSSQEKAGSGLFAVVERMENHHRRKMTVANRKLSIFDNFEQLSNAAAEELAKLIENRIIVHERFSLALSGGSTPGRLYEILAEEPYKQSIPWRKVDLFWVDERCVNPDDDESNYRLVKELLLRKIEIPEENIHRIKGELSPEIAAAQYKRELINCFGEDSTDFDLVILGFGKDGHTGSLFPGSTEIHDHDSLVLTSEVSYDGRPSKRVTLGLLALKQARHIFVLASGKAKAEITRLVLVQNDRELPISLVSPEYGELFWMIDKEAAGLLPKDFLD